MPIRFYLATRKNRAEEGARVASALRIHGWECTFDWTAIQPVDPEHHAEIAESEIGGIKSADVVIVLMPGGYGTHVELGAALSLGKPVVMHVTDRALLDEPYPCVFHHHPLVKIFVSASLNVENVIDYVRSSHW